MKFKYINITNTYPFDRHLIDGLIENGHKVSEIEIKSTGLRKYYILYKKIFDGEKSDAIFIGYLSPHFAIIANLFCLIKKERIVFNAVHTQYEPNITGRGLWKYSPKALKFRLIDFLAFHLSWRVLLESENQIDYSSKLTTTNKKKLIKSFSGVDEKNFFYNPDAKKLDAFTVLFRGRFLPESGIETVVKTAHILDGSGINFRIIGHGHLHREYNKLLDELKPKNIEEMTKTLPIEVLREKMQECHISLGQLGDNERLDRTLPCKLFETLAMNLPYLTGRNKGALELLTEDVNCFCVTPDDPKELAEKILYLRNNQKKLNEVAENGYKLYKEKLTSKELSMDIVKRCFS